MSPEEAFGPLHACVGKEGPPIRGTITARDIERFAVATGETSPVYTDADAARAAGYPALPAPPMLLPATIEWHAGPALTKLRVDGTGVSRDAWLPLDGLRLMGGGQDLTFHAPVLDGTQFVGRPRLNRVELKVGASGTLLMINLVTDYEDGGGRPLLTCHETVIGR